MPLLPVLPYMEAMQIVTRDRWHHNTIKLVHLGAEYQATSWSRQPALDAMTGIHMVRIYVRPGPRHVDFSCIVFPPMAVMLFASRFSIPWHFLSLALPLFAPQAEAQYLQDYIWQRSAQGQPVPFWAEAPGSAVVQGVNLYPATVTLEYNCHYLREICVNYDTFANSPRGQRQRYPGVFGYDMKSKRKNKRRNRSCPTGSSAWANSHTCPESNQQLPNQQLPMRQDKQWYYTALDPFNFGTNLILNLRDTNFKTIERSDIRYSCDEYPAASWIEGGGEATPPNLQNQLNHGDAFTRCAAIACPRAPGTKAEQNWYS